jgi:hypothetical protein
MIWAGPPIILRFFARSNLPAVLMSDLLLRHRAVRVLVSSRTDALGRVGEGSYVAYAIASALRRSISEYSVITGLQTAREMNCDVRSLSRQPSAGEFGMTLLEGAAW